MTMSHFASAALFIGYLWLGGDLPSQCPTPNTSGDDLNVVWGGDARAVHMVDVGGNRRVIIGEDGGRIRRSVDGGNTWTYTTTPADYTNTVLDIEFLDDDAGFSAGRGGQILETTDGGTTWNYFGNIVKDPCDDGATIWTIHPVTRTIMFIGGLWTSRYTVDGGLNWLEFELHDQGATYNGNVISEKELHIYGIDVVGTLGNFRGLIAAEWHHPTGPHRGIVLYTDAADPNSSVGRRWRVTLDDETFSGLQLAGGDKMVEAWAVEFERGSAPNNSATAFVVGGRGANGGGRGYRTTDSGQTWSSAWAGAPTPYDIAVEQGGRVMIAAYSGVYFTLNAAGGTTWTKRTLPGPPGGDITPGTSTAALGAIDSTDGDHFVVSGGFGINLKTADYGTTWTEASPRYALSVEENRIGDIFADRSNPKVAWVVGQLGRIMKTTDGGCTWSSQLYKPQTGALNAVAFRDSNNGVAVGGIGSAATGSKGALLYTLNGGASWLKATVVLGSAKRVTFKDVAMQGTSEVWAVGSVAGAVPSARIFYSRTNGQHWVELVAPPQHRLELEGVVWPDQRRGLIIGWSQAGFNADSIARAYLADFDPNTGVIVWTEVSPPHPTINPNSGNPNGLLLPLRQKLLSIDASNGLAATAEIYAVGNGGMVFHWDDAASRFADVPAVFDIDGLGNLISRTLTIDLSSVGVSPSGDHCLIAGQYDIGIFKWADLGFGLRLDTTGWSRIPTKMGKSGVGISLSGDGDGYVAGRTATVPFGYARDGERLHQCVGYETNDQGSASFDHGNLADSVILRYIAR